MTGGPTTTVATREEVQRLINALRADPTLRDELERAILADKLLHLPEQVAILIDIMRSFAEAADTQFAALHKRLGNVEADVSTLKADVSTLKADVSTLKADVNTLKADVSTLKADVSTLKTDVNTLKADVNTLKADVSTLKADVSTLKADVNTLKADVNTLKTDSGKTRGKLLEEQVRHNPGRFLGRYARRLKALSVDDVLDSNGVALDDEKYGVFSRADAFLAGSERGTGHATVIVVEATWRVSTDDVKRTAAWVSLLNSVGVLARGAIISVEPPRDSVRRAAEAESLWVVVDSYDQSAA